MLDVFLYILLEDAEILWSKGPGLIPFVYISSYVLRFACFMVGRLEIVL